MGAVWAYDVIMLFIGPEMSQDERNEEAEAAIQIEKLRKSGMSLSEVGAASESWKVERELEIQRLESLAAAKEMGEVRKTEGAGRECMML